MSPPSQRPGRSKQDYGTPREFIAAVERRWGKLTFDLAASKENTVTRDFLSIEQDSLKQNWTLLGCGPLWLNPPFADIRPWAEKAEKESTYTTLLMLVPASVGSNWYAEHAMRMARTIFLRPRLTFVGCSAPYPKDLMLLEFGTIWSGEFESWRWDRW